MATKDELVENRSGSRLAQSINQERKLKKIILIELFGAAAVAVADSEETTVVAAESQTPRKEVASTLLYSGYDWSDLWSSRLCVHTVCSHPTHSTRLCDFKHTWMHVMPIC